ncbi:peptidase [Bifidobacterium pseudolongum subsp. globosum]|uniref:Peptidase n=1 Tax=Bifidobacterium pseudolongum subsp. globosum TaxID=1690 RepID=A0A4Q5AEL3_9BIFI|nr:BspA family leucine-rich repeat surface protein [Bifidobacterium pseudolongum]RYQ25913.1 peptidase [Bifidobacterium pseudolongum subsp. globosum]RYQ27904.1 peptidase [Bifidobacterium pseudolongum subsp. globosum]
MVRALIALVMGLTVMMPGIPMTTSQWLGRVSSMGANTDSEQSKVHEIKRDTGITQTLVEYEPTVRPAVNDTTMENRVIPVEDTKQADETPLPEAAATADEPADGGYMEEDGWTVNEATVTYQSGDTYAFDDGSHENKVKYRSAWKGNPETKYAHTRNVNNDGVQSGAYGNNVVSTQVVTIPNATSLNVSLTYQTENNMYDWVCAYQGVGGKESCDASLTGKLGGTSKQTEEFTVDGDTVTFWFRANNSNDNYYGYHATVTGESMIVHNTILDGTVRTPVIPEDDSGNAFLGWKPNPETMPIMVDMTTEAVYGQWREWGTCLWSVDDDGVLRIRPKSGDSGELGSTYGSMSGAPWYGRNVTRIESQGTIILNQDSSYLFYGQRSLASLSALANWDVSQVTRMGSLFSNCTSLSDLSGLANWDVSQVTRMYSLFSNCTSLSDLSGLANWDVSQVTDMSSLFYNCTSLSDLSGLANWDVSRVTGMSYLFYNCTSLSDLSALANWDVSRVTDMGSLFSNCTSLSDLSALAAWDVSRVIGMYYLFSNCTSLSDLSGLANWDVSRVTDMGYLFSGCTSLSDLSGLANWNVSRVTDMGYLFSGCTSLSDLSGLANWNVSRVTGMSSLFSGCTSLSDLSGLANWNVSRVTGMSYLFYNCTSLSDLSALANWDVSQVTRMYSLFYNCTSLSDLSGLAAWDVSRVTDMGSLFSGCTSLSDLSGLANWNVSRVTDMGSLFSNCTSLSDLSALAAWDVSRVTDMYSLFSGCTSLSDLSALANWDVSQVTRMYSLFYNCTSLSDLSALANWNVSRVTDMGSLFSNCTSLSDLSALAAWDVSRVIGMGSLFSNCTSLSDLSALAAWDVSRVTNMYSMFSDCTSLSDVSAIAHWNLSSIPKGSNYWDQMFNNCGNLTRIGVPASQHGGDSFIHWNAIHFSNAMPKFIEETGDRQYNSWTSLYDAMQNTPTGYQQGIVYVKYTPSWIVNFDANGGIGTQTRMLVPVEDLSVELPSCEFMRFGYRFAGWTAQPDPISDMNPVLTTLTPATHNDGDRYTVYAQWEKLGDADEQPSTPASGMLPGWIQVGAENTSSTITPLQTGTTTFTNRYAPGSTSIVFKFTKLMDGNVPDQSYEFELLDQNGHVLQTVRNIGSTVAFQPINYTAEGEHVYLVREKNPNNDKLQYDDHLVQISVKVTGEGEQLKAEAIILGDTVFRNTSTPAVLSISKSVEHADQYTPDKDTQFTFDVELTDRDGKPVNGDYNMSIGDHAQAVTFKDGRLNLTLKAGQTATIKDIPAHAKYKVSETNLPDGYTLKDNALVNANGTLDANATVTVTAVNKYEPKNGAAMVQAVKKLLYANTDTAYVLKADQFRFTLCEVRPTDADPDNCVGVADTTNLKDGTVTFPQLEYDQPGTHTYQMREVIGVDSGITYDKQIVTVTVNVTDNGSGRLQTTVNYRNGTEPTFVNRIWNAPLLPQTGNVAVWALCATILLGGVFLAVQRGKHG